jgi:phosphoribosylaminoimidazole carboxylase
MLAAEAALLNVPVVILDSGVLGPAKQIVSSSSPETAHINGSFTDPEQIRALAERVDILTVEIEHVDADVLDAIAKEGRVEVHPAPSTIRLIQDKLVQKEHLSKHGISIGEFVRVESSPDGLKAAAERFGLPFMLKSRTLAYDGRGNFVVRDLAQIDEALATLGDRPLYAEKWVPFAREVAVMAVRTTAGEVRTYPVVETVHKNSICHLVFAPLRSSDLTLAARASALAEQALKTFEGAGIFGIEMFLLADGESIACYRIPLITDLTIRYTLHQRNRSPASQFGTLHYRGLRVFAVCLSPSGHLVATIGVDCSQGAVKCNAQPHRAFVVIVGPPPHN